MRRQSTFASFGATLAISLASGAGCSPASSGQPRAADDEVSSDSTPLTVAIARPESTGAPNNGAIEDAPEERPLHSGLDGCRIADVIEDGENDDNQIIVHNGRAGYLYTFVDAEGTTIDPGSGALGGVFAMAPGGAANSARALQMQGRLARANTIFAGLGLNFLDPRDAYDASAYDGVTFYAKAHGDVTSVRFGLMDVNTDPDGLVCSQCYNSFGADLVLSSQWERVTLRFSALRQAPEWGKPRPPHLDPSKLYSALWQVSEPPGGSYDVWVDDFAFVSCR